MPTVTVGAGLSHRPPVSRGLELGRLSDLLPGTTLMGRYQVESPIGRGSMGVVFAAYDLVLGERVALKLLDPELSREPATVARFRAEALAPQRIGTDHVVRVLAADVCPELVALTSPHDPMAPPVPYIVMERLVGQDLRQVLYSTGPLEFRRVAALLKDVAPTLDRAHALGIVHRDLKPANLFLSSDAAGVETVKVLDFGVAELADAGAARGLGGGLFGTPWYMAPEQAASGVASAASDRWALAVVAFRLLTNESYWAPAPVAELLARIVAGPVEPPSRVVAQRMRYSVNVIGPSFDAWFRQACAVDPRDRFESVVAQQTAMSHALESDAAGSP
jgi:serine/threonine-protein kinase